MNLAASAADPTALNLKRSLIQGARPKLQRRLQLSTQLAQTRHQLSGQLLFGTAAQHSCPGTLCGNAAQLGCPGQLLGSCGRVQRIVVVASDSGTGCGMFILVFIACRF